MSCFIHEDETYDRVYAAVCTLGFNAYYFTINKEFSCEDWEKWVQRLRAWNYLAWNERYPNRHQNWSEWKPELQPRFSDIELLKILQSINYQCIDANAYKGSKEEKEVEKIISDLQSHIISELTEYKQASWGM